MSFKPEAGTKKNRLIKENEFYLDVRQKHRLSNPTAEKNMGIMIANFIARKLQAHHQIQQNLLERKMVQYIGNYPSKKIVGRKMVQYIKN
jgi:hypothetical protein